MDVLDTKTQSELLHSMVTELAKSQNELKCAHTDLRKAQGRITFLLVLANELINRQEIHR